MNYSECLDFLYNTLPMFSRTGHAALKEGLGNTEAICRFLNHPEREFRSIHVAGTNGKGSVSHMLASVLHTAGYSTGLYTSPHLTDFRERIRVNGAMISKEAVVDFTERSTPLIQAIEPSFFEITVGMAFAYFAAQKVDVAVIETGLGGRLDSTNVIVPELSVITNIGFDHMQILGDTLDKIAFEKAGIIKNRRPVVIGRACEISRRVFLEKAAAEEAPLVFAEEEATTLLLNNDASHIEVEITQRRSNRSLRLSSDLPGLYQQENIATACIAIRQLQQMGWKISEEQIKEGIGNTRKNTGLQGRWESIRNKPLLIADVAHNADGISNIIRQLERSPHDKLFIVLGVSKEKDTNAMLSLLPREATYGFTQAHIPRALDKSLLQTMALQHGLTGQLFSDVNDAIATFVSLASPKDLILICGSVFVVGEIDRERFCQ